MKTSIFPPSFLRVTVLLALTSQFAFAQKITTFDFPGGLATTPTAISASGRIAGYYGDQQAVAVRAFVRSFNGKFTAFDAPGSNFTMPTGVNQAEQIVGLYGEDLDFGHLQLGFLRNFNGTIATFNGGTGTVTSAEDINDLGQVIGSWVDLGQVSHGFLRNPDGTIISFDAGSGGFFGTAAVAINAFGDTAFCGRPMAR